VDFGCFFCRLIELRQTLADLCSAQTDDGIFAGLIIWPTAEHFGADYTLAKKMIFPSQGVLDDIAEEILALLGVAKGRAGQHLIQSV
jgi:hypothetical protein